MAATPSPAVNSTINLSNPSVFTFAELKTKPKLVSQIVFTVNTAFARSKLLEPEKWGTEPVLRFNQEDDIWTSLGDYGFIGVIFDRIKSTEGGRQVYGNTSEEIGSCSVDRVVAVAAAVPWVKPMGDWPNAPKDKEVGWEMKIVSVDGDAKYARTGLAVKVMQALEQRITKLEVGKIKDGEVASDSRHKSVRLWIQTGYWNEVYWKKRGYTELRRAIQPPGTWRSKVSFDLLVMAKDVELKLNEP